MKVKHYNEMMAYLTRPGFNGGGSVSNNTVLPKRKPAAEVKKRKKINYEKIKQYLGKESQDLVERELGFAIGGGVSPNQLKQRFMEIITSIQEAEAEEVPMLVAEAKDLKDKIDELNKVLAPERQIQITAQGIDFDNPLLDAAKIAQTVDTTQEVTGGLTRNIAKDVVPESLTTDNPAFKGTPDYNVPGAPGVDEREKIDAPQPGKQVGINPRGKAVQASMRMKGSTNLSDMIRDVLKKFDKEEYPEIKTEDSFADGGRIGFDRGGMAQVVQYVEDLPKGSVVTRQMLIDYVKKNNLDVNIANFISQKVPKIKNKKFITDERISKTKEFQKEYKKGIKFYKDKGLKPNMISIRANVLRNEGKFISKGKLREEKGLSGLFKNYEKTDLLKDLKAGKTPYEISIEYLDKNEKNILKTLEGKPDFSKPLKRLSTELTNAISKDKELGKLYKKILDKKTLTKKIGPKQYNKDVENLLPLAQEQGLIPKVNSKGDKIDTASKYFQYSYKQKRDPIAKLFNYAEKIGIEHPAGIARAIIFNDPATLNEVVATLPDTNTLAGQTFDKYATGQAKFFERTGDSKYIKSLNKIINQKAKEFGKPKTILDVKEGKVVRRPTKFSLTNPDLFVDAKSFINEYIAAGGSKRKNFDKLDSTLQDSIRQYEKGETIKGNQKLKEAMNKVLGQRKPDDIVLGMNRIDPKALAAFGKAGQVAKVFAKGEAFIAPVFLAGGAMYGLPFSRNINEATYGLLGDSKNEFLIKQNPDAEIFLNIMKEDEKFRNLLENYNNSSPYDRVRFKDKMEAKRNEFNQKVDAFRALPEDQIIKSQQAAERATLQYENLIKQNRENRFQYGVIPKKQLFIDIADTFKNMAPSKPVENVLGTQIPTGQMQTEFAGGGLAKGAGDESGPPPESGPTPQGLASIIKRGRKY